MLAGRTPLVNPEKTYPRLLRKDRLPEEVTLRWGLESKTILTWKSQSRGPSRHHDAESKRWERVRKCHKVR